MHWRLLTRLLDCPVVVWTWFCDISKSPTPTLNFTQASAKACSYAGGLTAFVRWLTLPQTRVAKMSGAPAPAPAPAPAHVGSHLLVE